MILRLLSIVCATQLIFFAALAQELPAHRSTYVNDFAEVLSPETEAELEVMLRDARTARGHEMSVVTIKRRAEYGGYSSLAQFSKELMNAWGIGNPDRNDGLLLVIATQDREARLALGTGYRARYDGIATRIIDRVILPEIRAGRMQEAVVAGTREALIQLATPTTATQESLWDKLVSWAEGKLPLLIFIIGALAISAKFILRRFDGVRDRFLPRKCPECQRRMLRLGNVQEAQYLNDAQLLEENLNAKNYTVWICPHDEHLKIKGRSNKRSRFKACPECGYHTREVHTHILIDHTYERAGLKDLTHRCANCNFQRVERKTIPRMRGGNSRGPGGSFGSGRGGGGSSGFGGGSSSGGGGSGSW